MEEREEPDRLVLVSTYRFRHDAEVVRAMLEARGIDASIVADDCGGLQPAFAATSGVKLMVRYGDAAEAVELLQHPNVRRNSH